MRKAANYLVETLRSYGLHPQIQEELSVKGTLRNVTVRIPGSNSARALLIRTHSDSFSVGAGDNASGTAVLLEAARSLQAGSPPTTTSYASLMIAKNRVPGAATLLHGRILG